MASASASASRAGTRVPVRPGMTASGLPPTSVATTGLPSNMASTIASGRPSQSEELTNTSRADRKDVTSSTKPGSRKRPSRPDSATSRSSAGRLGPSPATAKYTSGRWSTTRRAAPTRYSYPFCSSSRPTEPTSVARGGARPARTACARPSSVRGRSTQL